MTPPAFLDPSQQPRDGGILDLIYLPARLRPSTTLPAEVAAAIAVVESQLTALVRPATATRPDVPRSWHEAWLDTADTHGRSDVFVHVIGRWPAMCDDRHEWLLQTPLGTRYKTTSCTRRNGHKGRHAAVARRSRRGYRVVAVWEYP